MDTGLRSDFGFKDIAWFYSGRRGVHCWVCDDEARKLSNEARSAVAGYFELPLENAEQPLDGVEAGPNLHPMLKRAEATLEPMFRKDILGEQGILDTPERWVKLLKTLPEEVRKAGLAADLDVKWKKGNYTGEEKVREEGWAAAKPSRHFIVYHSTH